ncbi:MAG: acyl-CoA dehydrogenase [Sneathiella sp.]|nr:MAG: acyl-CoA dehydrogenase [Sneathiella sp.]
MYFGLSEEQLMIQDSFRRSLERSVNLDSIRTVSATEQFMDAALWQELTELGMPALMISEKYGGAGLGLLEAAVVAEEIGRSAAPVPFIGTSVMAPLALDLAGSEDQKATWLPKLASGKTRIGIAFADRASGVRRGSGVTAEDSILNGKTSFALDMGEAEALIVADAEGNLYLVENAARGLAITYLPTIDGTRTTAEITFHNVEAEKLPQGTPDLLHRIVNAGRIAMAAESYGAADDMLRQAVAYAMDRKQFDRIIGSFQAVKHMCAEMAAELQPCRALIWYAAYAFDAEQDDVTLSALLAKSHMDDIGQMIARTATEVHGGMGYTDLLGLHFWFKRIGFNRAQLGGPEKLRQEAALLQGFG